jgi:hypothetical protein
MPYPKNRRRLAEIAMEYSWWDIAAAFNVDGDLSFDDWLSVFETNLPQEYRHWMVLGMCALNSAMFEPEDPDNPTKKDLEIAEKYAEFLKIGENLLEHLEKLQNEGKEIVARPPNAHYRRFWYNTLERRMGHGKTTR